VRIGIVSDIHCNRAALDRAVEQMGEIDELLCAGDACYQYRFSNDVAERLRELGGRYVLGNHEEILLSAAGARAQASPTVDRELLEWTREQPHLIRAQIGSKKLLMFHATPWAPYRDYLFPHDPQLQRVAEEDADFIIYGHTHAPLVTRIGRALIVNPGSAGEARGSEQLLTYAVLDTSAEAATIEQIRFA
jgi:putative phosphoesterase